MAEKKPIAEVTGLEKQPISHIEQVNEHGQPVIFQSETSHTRSFNTYLIYSCIVSGAASVLFGYDDKIISPVAAIESFVKKFQGADPATGEYVLSARSQDLVFCLPLVGAILGALLAAPITTRFGRKWPLVGCYALSYAGTFLQTFAPVLGAFVVGRFFNSILMAIAMVIAPLYLSEIVPSKHRGKAVTSSNIFNLISGVIGTVIANATYSRPDNSAYRIPIAIQAAMPTILIPATLFIPESPMWLIMNGREEEARKNLRSLRAFDDKFLYDEVRVMRLNYEKEQLLTRETKITDLFTKENIQRTLVAGSMYSVNQISGVILSSTYATVFLTALGVGNPFQLTIAASCTILAGTCIAPLVVDRIGRRPVAIIGMSVLMIIDFIAGGLAFYLDSNDVPLAIASLSFIFNVVWAASFYCLSLTLPTEIPTPRLRNLTASYTLGCAYTTAVITTFAVPQLVSADAANLGAKTYLVFGCCVAIVLAFYYFFLPETAGRTFAEIDEMYENKVSPRKWKKYKTSAASRQAVVVSDPSIVHA